MRVNRIILLLMLVALAACSRIAPEQPDGGMVPVTIRIGVEDGIVATKGETALSPEVENYFRDLWVLQYSINDAGQGDLLEYKHVLLPYQMAMSTTFDVELRPVHSLLVIIANCSSPENVYTIFDENSSWPGIVSGPLGVLHTPFGTDVALDIDGLSVGGRTLTHMFMCGYEETDVVPGANGKFTVSVLLSRICAKIGVAMSVPAGDYAMTDVSVQVLNASKGFTITSTPDVCKDYVDYAPQMVGTLTPGAARKYQYFYVCENILSEEGRAAGNETKLKITGKVNGAAREKVIPITDHGNLYRNTFYNLDLVFDTK